MNVLFGYTYNNQGLRVMQFLCDKLKRELCDCGLEVERLDVTRTKQQVEEMLATNKYEVLICNEVLGEDRIGGGSLRAWERTFPNVKVILCLATERKGKEKMLNLLNNEPCYYNAIFENDLVGKVIAKLIESGRTREEAIIYYGVEDRVNVSAEPETPVVQAVEIVEPVVGGAVESEVESTTPSDSEVVTPTQEEPMKILSEEELEKIVSAFSEFDAPGSVGDEAPVQGVEPNVAAEEGKGAEADSQGTSSGFDFSSMMGGADLFGGATVTQSTAGEEPVPVMVETDEDGISGTGEDDGGDWIVREMMENQRVFEQSMKEKNSGAAVKVDESKKSDEGFGLVSMGKQESKFPEVGVVKKVIDQDTMLLEIEGLCLAEGESMEDYRIAFIVKGTKGGFVNGKYKVGVKSFEGYPGDMLGSTTLIVEVPSYNLVENGIEGKECTLIFAKQ